MKFENKYAISKKEYVIYCGDDYYKKCDNNGFYYDIIFNKLYYKGHLVHHENGPAFESINGDKQWYLNGKEYSEEDYLSIVNLKNKQRVLNDI